MSAATARITELVHVRAVAVVDWENTGPTRKEHAGGVEYGAPADPGPDSLLGPRARPDSL